MPLAFVGGVVTLRPEIVAQTGHIFRNFRKRRRTVIGNHFGVCGVLTKIQIAARRRARCGVDVEIGHRHATVFEPFVGR